MSHGISNNASLAVAQANISAPKLKGSCNSMIDSSAESLARTILQNQEAAEFTKANTNPKFGGISASAIHISNSFANISRFIASNLTRILGEHILSTGLVLNSSICQKFLEIIKRNLTENREAPVGYKGCSNIHEINSSCNFFRSILNSVHDLENSTREILSNPNAFFGANLSSAYLWMLVPEVSGLLLVSASEAIFHGVESGALSVGALAEFEPFCEAAAQLIGRCCKDGQTLCRQSYDDMKQMIDRQSYEENILRQPAIQTTQAKPTTRQATHLTYAGTLFSVPLAASQLATFSERATQRQLARQATQGTTLASQHLSQVWNEIKEQERQPDAKGWPETGSFGRIFSLFNTMREAILQLSKEKIQLPNEANGSSVRKESIANSALQSSNASLFISLLTGEILSLRPLLARLSQAPQTAQLTNRFTQVALEGTHKETLCANDSKKGTSNTDNTQARSRQQIKEAMNVTKHEAIKGDACLVSAGSELPTIATTAGCFSKSALTYAETTQETNNEATKTLSKTTECLQTLGITKPLFELTRILKDVCEAPEQERYTSACNKIIDLCVRFEEIQNRLMKNSGEANGVESAYSGTICASMEPTVLSTLSGRTVSQLCEHLDRVKESLKKCLAAFREASGNETNDTGNRTNLREKLVSNVINTLSHFTAGTSEASIEQINQTRATTDPAQFIRPLETAISIASTEAAEMLILLTNNSGNLLRQTDRLKLESDKSTLESEEASGHHMTKTMEKPEEKLCDNGCSSGSGATTNTAALVSITASQIVLKLFEAVHALGSFASETLLQALITATHPVDRTLASTQTWEDRIWMQEFHPIPNQSKSISTEHLGQTAANIATMAFNVLCWTSIISGSAEHKQLEIIPAPEALKNMLDAFGESDIQEETVDISKLLVLMQNASLNRENILYHELRDMLKKLGKRGSITFEKVANDMWKTRAWIEKVQRHPNYLAEPALKTALETYILHLVRMADGRRFKNNDAPRELLDREMKNLCVFLMQAREN